MYRQWEGCQCRRYIFWEGLAEAFPNIECTRSVPSLPCRDILCRGIGPSFVEVSGSEALSHALLCELMHFLRYSGWCCFPSSMLERVILCLSARHCFVHTAPRFCMDFGSPAVSWPAGGHGHPRGSQDTFSLLLSPVSVQLEAGYLLSVDLFS